MDKNSQQAALDLGSCSSLRLSSLKDVILVTFFTLITVYQFHFFSMPSMFSLIYSFYHGSSTLITVVLYF